jgi:peptide-methionine (R)-S-oxide reductase
MNWSDIQHRALTGNPAPHRWVDRSPEEWQARLLPEEYRVTRQHGTEKAFEGEFCAVHPDGLYACVGCGEPLFDSRLKFESGTGWPSFTEPLQPELLRYHEDHRDGMDRIEVRCNICNAHLGHVFPDGPPPGGLRYCINSAALLLLPADQAEPFFLQYETLLQGEIDAARPMLIFVFRMSCPGCFLYGFDQAEGVRAAFPEQELQVIGLSTAFGNDADEVVEETRRFLEAGELHPEVEAEFEELHVANKPWPVAFPVAVDRITPPDEFLNAETLQWFYRLNPNYPLISAEDVKTIVHRSKVFYTQFPKVAHTFALNFLPGTPCFVLLDKNGLKLESWLGHQPVGPLVHKIGLHLQNRD